MLRLLGRSRRRYLTVVFVFIAFYLWRTYGFWVLAPRVFVSRSYQLDGYTYVTSSYDWSRAPVYYPVAEYYYPPSGPPNELPLVQARASAKAVNNVTEYRRQEIKDKFVKSWNAYKKHAWKKDELKPLSGKGKKSLSGWSAQIVDGLDTLWIMGLKEEFREAVAVVAKIDWSRTTDWSINIFEVTIRYLGGLIAAYDLSGEAVLLAKAIELGDTLYGMFDTPNRMPVRWYQYGKAVRGRQIADENMSGAAGGTLCLEFTRLTQITGDIKYYDATERIKRFFAQWQRKTKLPGIWPNVINWRDETMDQVYFTIGAGMDSMYEYLPKMHAILGGLDPDYISMTPKALDVLKEHILFRPMNPKDEDILMAGAAIATQNGKSRILPDMQHLACFAGGMYALTGKLYTRPDFIDIGARLTKGCVWAYDAFPTNIMPEKAQMIPCRTLNGKCGFRPPENPDGDVLPGGFLRMLDARYLLRPEAIESVFYMWRITGEDIWRDAAWRMWEGIVKETETNKAFASISDVMVAGSEKIDSMETFWIGETLKYFYLIFEDESIINLDEWVLNTEAHPFKRPSGQF